MLTSFVLKRSYNSEYIFEEAIRIRYTEEARRFREGMCWLTCAIASDDRKLLSEVSLELEHARHEWNKSEDFDPTKRTKKISFSLPWIGLLGMDFDIKYPKNTPASHLLTFIHKMVKDQ